MKKQSHFSPEDLIKKVLKGCVSHGTVGRTPDNSLVLYGITKDFTTRVITINMDSHKIAGEQTANHSTKEDAVEAIKQYIRMFKAIADSKDEEVSI